MRIIILALNLNFISNILHKRGINARVYSPTPKENRTQPNKTTEECQQKAFKQYFLTCNLHSFAILSSLILKSSMDVFKKVNEIWKEVFSFSFLCQKLWWIQICWVLVPITSFSMYWNCVCFILKLLLLVSLCWLDQERVFKAKGLVFIGLI